MFKPTSNPKIEALTKSHRERTLKLIYHKPEPDEFGKRWCLWCGVVEVKHVNRKYCDRRCGLAMFAWANPQVGVGLHYLLNRQEWRCNSCAFNYFEILRTALTYFNRNNWLVPTIGKDDSRRFMSFFKDFCPQERKPEVDHVVPIYKGGQALGFDNHQAICALCHKIKTKKDLSGPRQKEKANAEIQLSVSDPSTVPDQPREEREDGEMP